MSASEVSIANRALQQLGAGTITALTQDNTIARNCNLAYSPIRESLLRENNWVFAIARAELAADVATPLFEFNYQYSLPLDCLKVVRPTWIIENRKILTNEIGPIQIRYIQNVTDPNTMDPLFRELLSINLAIAIQSQIAPNAKLEKLFNIQNMLMAQAKKSNAIEKESMDDSVEDTWLSARL